MGQKSCSSTWLHITTIFAFQVDENWWLRYLACFLSHPFYLYGSQEHPWPYCCFTSLGRFEEYHICLRISSYPLTSQKKKGHIFHGASIFSGNMNLHKEFSIYKWIFYFFVRSMFAGIWIYIQFFFFSKTKLLYELAYVNIQFLFASFKLFVRKKERPLIHFIIRELIIFGSKFEVSLNAAILMASHFFHLIVFWGVVNVHM